MWDGKGKMNCFTNELMTIEPTDVRLSLSKTNQQNQWDSF